MYNDGLSGFVIFVVVLILLVLGIAFGANAAKKSYEEGKFCPTCGYHYSEDDLYCPNDGTELLIVGGK